MVNKDQQSIDRRRFLQVAGASGGLFGMSALAGCSGGGDGGDSDGGGGEDTETETEMDSGGGGSTETSTEAGAEMGDKLPQYRYFNNPPNYNPARNDAINLIGEQLKKAGLDISVEVFEWGTLYTKVRNERDFEFCTWHHGLGVDPGQLMEQFFHSDNLEAGTGNFTGWHSEETDKILSQQMSTTDADERVDLLHEFQETIVKAAPTNAITWMPQIVAYNSDQVGGWSEHPAGFNGYYNQTQVNVDNENNQLRGSWSETLGTLNVVGGAEQSKIIYQFDMLYDKLVRFDTELQPDPEISLAQSWERPEKTTMRYTLKDHQWHDGEDLTAEDVAFTLNYLKEHEAPSYATQTGMYSDAEAVDSQTVQVNFTEDGAPGPVHTLFSFQIPIIPKHIWEGRDQPLDMQVSEPIGSGPLEFDYWDQGSELGLVRNGDHFNPPNYESRIWRIIPEISTVWSLLKQGELNYLPFSRIGKQLADNSELDQISVATAPGTSWWHCSMNTRKPGLDARPVRQAVVHAIPKTAIIEQLLYGYPEKGKSLITPAFGPYYNDDVKVYEEGVDNAKSRLQEAGYKFDDDGMVHFPAE